MSGSSSSPPLRPIILVTGANSGLGFATCQRLLLQLSSPLPSDTLPVHPAKRSPDGSLLPTPFPASSGCTLLLACRNPTRAQNAQEALLKIVERLSTLPDTNPTPTSVAELERWGVSKAGGLGTLRRRETKEVIDAQPDSETSGTGAVKRDRDQLQKRKKAAADGTFEPKLQDNVENREARARGEYRRNFCRGTKIDVVPLDLASLASVRSCVNKVSEEHPYLTHLIHNAGGGAFEGIDWLHAAWMMITSLKAAVTRPRYKLQRNGDLSEDGLGWVWQVNVGGSWALTQGLLPLMRKSPYLTPPRVIFTSSVEAVQEYYDPQDFQCLRSDVPSHAYESTKYQCDLAAVALQEQLLEDEASLRRLGEGDDEGRKAWTQPDVFCTHPGVIVTNIMADFLNLFTATATLWTFYIARWLLSPHHCVAPYKGSIAHTFTSLAPRSQLHLEGADAEAEAGTGTMTMTRYASQCDFWGREYVGIGRIDGWGDKGDSAGADQVRTLAREWRRMTVPALAHADKLAGE